MRFWRSRRQPNPVGPRKNQWRGLQAERLATLVVETRRTNRIARRRRLLRLLGLMIGLVLAGWFGVEGVKYSGLVLQQVFEIRVIAVEGLHHLVRQDVLDLAKVKPGTPLHHIVTTVIKEQVESHPWVKEAVVARAPFHELRILIVERKPGAIVQTDTQNVLCDEEGYVLAKLGQTDDETLPLVTGIDPKGLFQGNESVRQTIVSGIELAQLMRKTFGSRLQVDAQNPSNLVASTRGLRFQFGDNAFNDRWQRFQLVKSTLKPLNVDGHGRGVQEVDLRYENRIIVREGG